MSCVTTHREWRHTCHLTGWDDVIRWWWSDKTGGINYRQTLKPWCFSVCFAEKAVITVFHDKLFLTILFISMCFFLFFCIKTTYVFQFIPTNPQTFSKRLHTYMLNKVQSEKWTKWRKWTNIPQFRRNVAEHSTIRTMNKMAEVNQYHQV